MFVVRTFPAKLLLFGEYTVLNGSQALAIPNPLWHGEWKKSNSNPTEESLNFIEWLYRNEIIGQKSKDEILHDFKAGWHFESTIPYGHGVGSSGAYVAAMYDRYVREYNANAAQVMAEMEGYFHGTSSGMDPLVSFENKTVLKNAEGKFQLCGMTSWPENMNVYLWDSGIERTTGELVNLYKQKCKDAAFKLQIERNLIPMVDHAIHFYLSNHGDMLENCIRTISQFQRTYFTEMIPDKVKIMWDMCDELDHVHMKLCGAGGGGFYLIFALKDALLPVQHTIQINQV